MAEIAAFRGPWADGVAWRWSVSVDPFTTAIRDGAETLGYILLGMAGYRSGFLTGAWSRRRYAWVIAVALPPTLAIHGWLACETWRSGFDLRRVLLASTVVSPAIRPVMVAGYAAAILLASRPGGRAWARLAATGRTALSNYLGTSLAMVTIFDGWGLGQFGHWSRASLYLLIPVVWVAMLLWPSWWLDRFAHGPVEWLWRAIARGALPPWRSGKLRTRRKGSCD